jgi:UDP-glucose:(heptosyl)LPS alpha-1,3-glucosyltransferase
MERKRIGLVRRGYSSSGGAERYLQRFASALCERGHEVMLFASPEWPEDEPQFREVIRIAGGDPISFADNLAKAQPRRHCDVLYSLERVWECDFYRAGDGVHRAWLERRAKHESPWRRWVRAGQRKHRQILELEATLFSRDSKTEIIVNSEMVKFEIQGYYGKPYERIHVVYNGYKPPAIAGDPRSRIRQELGLREEDVVLLFSGSGWDRKGLRYAIRAASHLRSEGVKLIVAGRGNPVSMPRGPVRYLGPVQDMPAHYEAADIFILPTLYDPFSNASLEAAAHGLPVVTTTANGFAEILPHGRFGSAVEDPADVAALVEGIRPWLPAARRLAVREEIRAWARSFHVRENLRQTLAILAEDGAGS